MAKFRFSLFFILMLKVANAAEITVSAAASLTDVFTDIVKAYQVKHPENHIRLNFAGSGALLQQILNGAPVDVFASADPLRMNKAEEADLLLPNTRQNFARNSLVVITPSQSKVNSPNLSAFIESKEIKKLAIANPEYVPAGRYSKNVLVKHKLWEGAKQKMIPAQNVRQALDYVARGEVDGGFVYKTDAMIFADKVKVIFSLPLEELPTYPIAVLKKSQQPELAKDFISFVCSQEGQEILEHYGFQKP